MSWWLQILAELEIEIDGDKIKIKVNKIVIRSSYHTESCQSI